MTATRAGLESTGQLAQKEVCGAGTLSVCHMGFLPIHYQPFGDFQRRQRHNAFLEIHVPVSRTGNTRYKKSTRFWVCDFRRHPAVGPPLLLIERATHRILNDHCCVGRSGYRKLGCLRPCGAIAWQPAAGDLHEEAYNWVLLSWQYPYKPPVPLYMDRETAVNAYPPVLRTSNSILVAYAYPPLMLLLGFPAYLLTGDARYTGVLVLLLVAFLLTRWSPDPDGWATGGDNVNQPLQHYNRFLGLGGTVRGAIGLSVSAVLALLARAISVALRHSGQCQTDDGGVGAVWFGADGENVASVA